LAVELLFGGAMAANLLAAELLAQKIAHDVIVVESEHAVADALRGNAEALKINLPGSRVERGGMDDNAVEIEEKALELGTGGSDLHV
jgi:hypothetical protein